MLITIKSAVTVIKQLELQKRQFVIFIPENSETAGQSYFLTFNAQCPKMVRHTSKILQHLLQDF